MTRSARIVFRREENRDHRETDLDFVDSIVLVNEFRDRDRTRTIVLNGEIPTVFRAYARAASENQFTRACFFYATYPFSRSYFINTMIIQA